jgi:hypothetical protein
VVYIKMSSTITATNLSISGTSTSTVAGKTTVNSLSSSSLGSVTVSSGYVFNTGTVGVTTTIGTFTTPNITGATTIRTSLHVTYSCQATAVGSATVTHRIQNNTDNTTYITADHTFYWNVQAAHQTLNFFLIGDLPVNTSCKYVIALPGTVNGNADNRVYAFAQYHGIT